MRRYAFLLVVACRASSMDVPMLDAAVALPVEAAQCGGGAFVSAQGVLYDAEYNAFAFDAATVTATTNPARIEIASATARITFHVDTAVGDYPDVFAQIRLGGEVSATQIAHVIIDESDGDCVAGRFEVALKGRVVGSFRTR
jgi:hypothetical protein